MPRANRAKVNQAMSDAVASRPKLPPLPDIVRVARWLRLTNKHQDGPGTVWLACAAESSWILAFSRDWPGSGHPELVPGDGKPFDAVAAARRLLAEARLAGFR